MKTIEKHSDCEKELLKQIEALDKLFRKNTEKKDIFMSLVGFIDCDREYRKALMEYGRTIIELRNSFIKDEVRLFS